MTKKITHYLFSILCFGLIFTACQKEETQFIDETDTDGTITATSTLTGLLLRTSQNPGSADDIIDGNSCSQIKYPVSVIANGQQVVLETEADLVLIHAIFDQFPSDEDTLEIIFPITVILQDFTELIIQDQDALDDLADLCEDEMEISCVNFVFPITIFTYNTDHEQTGTVVIDSDEELYLLLFGLDEEDLFSINFPIAVILENGTTVEVNSNDALETILENADCDDDETLDQVEENLTTGSWYITYYFDDYDETDAFNGYEFTFAADNTAQANNGTTTVPGTWNFTPGSSPELDLFFGTNPPFDELADDWEIVEATAEIIRLKDVSGGDGSVDYLTFERNPTSGGSNEEINILIENLTTGSWFVTLFEDDGTNNTSNFNEYEFTFFTNSSVTAVGASGTINGFWQIEDESGELEVILSFNSTSNENFEDLNDDWLVLESSQIIIRLSDEAGGGGSDLLTFERNPGGGGGNPDPQELRNIFQSGTWFVESYLDDGEDETAIFNGYNFTFFTNETVTATNGTQNVDGIWIVTIVGDELNFEFDMDSPINQADDDEYKVLQYSESSVTLIIRDDDGNIENTLTFEQN